jgi:hypothetical protein
MLVANAQLTLLINIFMTQQLTLQHHTLIIVHVFGVDQSDKTV